MEENWKDLACASISCAMHWNDHFVRPSSTHHAVTSADQRVFELSWAVRESLPSSTGLPTRSDCLRSHSPCQLPMMPPGAWEKRCRSCETVKPNHSFSKTMTLPGWSHSSRTAPSASSCCWSNVRFGLGVSFGLFLRLHQIRTKTSRSST